MNQLQKTNKQQLVRKAKEIQSNIVNKYNPKWVDPVDGPSGLQIGSSLETVRLHVYKELSTSNNPCPPNWHPAEWLAWRWLGLPSGEDNCLPTFQTPRSGNYVLVFDVLSTTSAIKVSLHDHDFP